MFSARPLVQYTLISIVGIFISGCSTQEEPAHKMISDIESAVSTASADAATYIPDQLVEVQKKLGALKASYDKKDYKAVVSGAPPVMSQAQSLESAAIARKNAVAKSLSDSWTAFSNTLPGHANAIEERIEFLGKPVNRSLAGGVDLDAARSGFIEAVSLWSKAKAAFSVGNMNEAVTTAKTVSTKLDGLAASLKLDFSEPAAVQDTTPVG